ncbi:MAG: gamma-butyrobetaine dioxygenase [Ilumatobacteraceae bacterium]|nr:gamma-butyrobetaine dioxygenase [Ilumatobacteraceae bacterium]
MADSTALTPDFDSHPIDHTLVSAQVAPAWIEVVWSDGRTSRFHHLWLRDNCPCERCVHQGTKEQMFELVTTSADLHPLDTGVGPTGALVVLWAPGGNPHDPPHCSEFHPGWLRRHAYDDASRRARNRTLITWDGQSLPEPPTFDGRAIMVDDDALYEWLGALDRFGVSRVQHVPCEVDAIADLVGRIGIIRETNFGLLWDVKSESNPISNANTSLPLPPHVDLPTREYQPGLQFLHCILNETAGGENILVDGYRIAELIREHHPADYEVLTTVPFEWANRSRTSDYRWSSPLIVTEADGSLREMRVGNWLRAPLDVPFDMVEACYRAYRRLFELTYRSDLQLRFRLEPGEVMAFDNRRALHARGELTDTSGRRFLRGCYSERDELRSRMRMIERARRERQVATATASSPDR